MPDPFRHEQFLTVLDRDEADRRFRSHLDLSPLEAETVPLFLAHQRVLAGDVRAPVDVPVFDRSNVDGFAVRAEDTFGASEDNPVSLALHPVGTISTGDELQPPGEPPRPGCVFDSNATVLADTVRELGGEPHPLGIVPDDLEKLRAVFAAALATCDAILLSGGTSKGAGDISYRVVGEFGPPGVVAHGVALKPGKPLCLAVVANCGPLAERADHIRDPSPSRCCRGSRPRPCSPSTNSSPPSCG